MNSEGWEWDPVKKEVRLLDTRSEAGAGAGTYEGKHEEDMPKVGSSSAHKVATH